MSFTARPAAQNRPAGRKVIWTGVKALLVGVLVWQGLRFWVGDALPYLLDHSEETFRRFWPYRSGLALHVLGGTLALFMGPFQFWSGLRRRSLAVHRWTGRLYLTGVLVGSAAGFYLAPHSRLGWTFAAGLIVLNFAWLLTSGMAYAAIRLRQISVHRDWMIRSYVVTFSFVIFRFLFYLPAARALGTPAEVAATFVWVSWVVPLLLTEAVLQVRSLQRGRLARGL